MKIIDLFNKIANDKDDILFSYLFNCLRTSDFINDEVEIVGVKEETRKSLEFIKYLESEIGCRELIPDSLFNHNKELKVYKEFLQKYKDIIGVSDDNKTTI